MKRLFGRYVSRDVYDQLVAHPELAELGGRRREMTVLFSDIRGFTTVTEKGNPEALVAQLNEYFSRMVEIVFRHRGTVDKFVGDMVMALFGAPLDDADHAEHAVQAAIDMVKELRRAEPELGGARDGAARHRHRHQLRRHDRGQHRIVGDHELHGHRRQREPRGAARIAEQGIQDPDYHQ